MSLAQRLSMAPPSPPGKKFCSIGRLLAGMTTTDDPTSDRVVLVTAMADRQWPSTAIATVLQDEGHTTISERHLRDHRAGRHTEAQCMAHDVGLIR